MDPPFLKNFYPNIYKACTPPGDVSSINFTALFMAQNAIEALDCVPMSSIIRLAGANHINFFVLDVEGAELNVLNTINWDTVKFDVVCIEVDPNHRMGSFPTRLRSYMSQRGYNFLVVHKKNHWFQRRDFSAVPMKHPRHGITLLNYS